MASVWVSYFGFCILVKECGRKTFRQTPTANGSLTLTTAVPKIWCGVSGDGGSAIWVVVWVRTHHSLWHTWFGMGGSAQGPFSHTAGGVVGSQDFSPDAVEWVTSEDTVGHLSTEFSVCWGLGGLVWVRLSVTECAPQGTKSDERLVIWISGTT